MISPAQRDRLILLHAEEEVKSLIGHIAAFEKIPDSRARSRDALIAEAKERLIKHLIRLGRLEEAKQYAISIDDLHQINRIDELLCAIDIDDSEKCNCPPMVVKMGPNDTKDISHMHCVERILSPKHNAMTNVMKCSKCGHLNVTNQR